MARRLAAAGGGGGARRRGRAGGAGAAGASARRLAGGGCRRPRRRRRESATAPRVLLSFPTDPNDLLLSGLLVGGEALAGRAVAIDSPVGKGHVVMFANRPYWRWQTQGNFFLGFNAILNWNDLDAGRDGAARDDAGAGFSSSLSSTDSGPVVGHVPDLEQRLAVHQARAA